MQYFTMYRFKHVGSFLKGLVGDLGACGTWGNFGGWVVPVACLFHCSNRRDLRQPSQGLVLICSTFCEVFESK